MVLVYQKIKLQKIKEKYLGFQGGDLTPICLLICCLGFLIYIWSGPKIFFVKCNPSLIITLYSQPTVCYCVCTTERNTMPQMSKQAYNNLMQASNKYAAVSYSIKLPYKPRQYFKSKQAMLRYKAQHNIALIYCTTHHQF